ncbi:hypothetical protein [Mesorhizobium sangaii]|uniref:Uncharacterized protein n=1 Tax=Mesorhizobium sangaii TaxID=505389 RepID=A0A841NWN1_9HYPH|nr:hypothetical protein [Mesorhizobium sangaii]MBB6407447.1 hypothetical protein [Mesorhizobium sangaii]
MSALIPTGRGSYVRAGTISLTELLRRYDMAEGHRTMTREAVIAAFVA